MSRQEVPVLFLKGHATGNDFVVLPDPDDQLHLSDNQVQRLCDRRFGVGADGILRVVASKDMSVADWMVGDTEWFMDYRNADGTIAEMCGNGARLFARYLLDADLVDADLVTGQPFQFGTRSGVRTGAEAGGRMMSVGMGQAHLLELEPLVVSLAQQQWSAIGVSVPNPHAVAFVSDLAGLGQLDSYSVSPGSSFPEGVNVEFVEVLADDTIQMRVHERGVGETLSCGTGACAAAYAHTRIHASEVASVTVKVPGGDLVVTEASDGDLTLTGPTEFVATGQLDRDWLVA